MGKGGRDSGPPPDFITMGDIPLKMKIKYKDKTISIHDTKVDHALGHIP